jgi:hypothetical protein
MSTRAPAASPEYDCDHCGMPITGNLRSVVRLIGSLESRSTPSGWPAAAKYILAAYDLHPGCEMPLVRQMAAQVPSVPLPAERWPDDGH